MRHLPFGARVNFEEQERLYRMSGLWAARRDDCLMKKLVIDIYITRVMSVDCIWPDVVNIFFD